MTARFTRGLDVVFHVRKAQVSTLREAAVGSSLDVGIAVLFGCGGLVLGGRQWGGQPGSTVMPG
jgi:hypothetical protein